MKTLRTRRAGPDGTVWRTWPEEVPAVGQRCLFWLALGVVRVGSLEESGYVLMEDTGERLALMSMIRGWTECPQVPAGM